MKKGTVLLFPNYPFPGGIRKDKRMIIVNQPEYDDDYIFVLTTSKKRTNPNQLGCHKTCYTIGAGQDDSFKQKTWILFHTLQFVSQKQLSNWTKYKTALIRNIIDTSIINLIIDCIKKSPNVLPKFQQYL